MSDQLILISVGIGGIVYFVLCNRMAYLAQPLRMEMLDLAAKLLGDPGLSDERVRQINRALDCSYRTYLAWLYVALLPVAVILVAVTGGRNHEDGIPRAQKADYMRFVRLHLVTTLSNSPLAAYLFVLEFMIFLVLFLPIGAAVNELLPSSRHGKMRLWTHGHA